MVPTIRFALLPQATGRNREPRAQWQNVAHILGRSGETLCTYAKYAAFSDKVWGEEAIVRGDELPILMAGDLVLGFAICKDFCDLAVATPFIEVPVDIVLVPSMGAASTLAGHVANAEGLRQKNGTLVFLVQQHPPGSSDAAAPLGYVLLSGPGAKPATQDQTWSIYQRPVPSNAARTP